MRVILHPGATLATGSSFHNRKVGRTNPVGHAGSKSEPTNANNLVSVDFCRAIQTFVIAAKPDRSLVWLVGCSSCKVPFFQSCGTGTHRGGTHLQLFSTLTKDRIPLTSGEHVLFTCTTDRPLQGTSRNELTLAPAKDKTSDTDDYGPSEDEF